MKKLALPVAVLTLAAACADGGPTSLPGRPAVGPSSLTFNAGRGAQDEIVITEGHGRSDEARAAAQGPRLSQFANDAPPAADVGGSSSSALVLRPTGCLVDGSAANERTITVTYTITGAQDGTATFKVPNEWVATGGVWTKTTSLATVEVAPRTSRQAATIKTVSVKLTNSDATAAGTSQITLTPQNLTNTNTAGSKLNIENGNVTVHTSLQSCPSSNTGGNTGGNEPPPPPPDVNTAPTIVVPNNMVLEATSSAGRVVNFTVTANDAEESDISSRVTCTPASGSTFALDQTTTVNCSVTDNGKGTAAALSAQGSFTVRIVDTTAPEFAPGVTANQLFTRIAANINGWSFSLADLAITATDIVDGAVTPVCTVNGAAAGTIQIGVGSFATTVTCTATDARTNAASVSFKVAVGLNVAATNYLSPLRMTAAFSGHKLGSTIPHKFVPPTYAGGAPATDLASGLNLTLTKKDGTPDAISSEVVDFSAGSTEWRYDALAGHYIFNAKSGTTNPWSIGSWITNASYRGITLAQTQLEFRR